MAVIATPKICREREERKRREEGKKRGEKGKKGRGEQDRRRYYGCKTPPLELSKDNKRQEKRGGWKCLKIKGRKRGRRDSKDRRKHGDTGQDHWDGEYRISSLFKYLTIPVPIIAEPYVNSMQVVRKGALNFLRRCAFKIIKSFFKKVNNFWVVLETCSIWVRCSSTYEGLKFTLHSELTVI